MKKIVLLTFFLLYNGLISAQEAQKYSWKNHKQEARFG